MKLKSMLLLAMTLLLSSCALFKLASLKKPVFSYVRCDVKKVGERKVDVDIVLSAYNPNDVGLKNVWVSYELFTHGKRFVKGDSIKIDLTPKDTTRIIVPAEIV